MSWLIYGANGYTGSLVAQEAVRRGMRPLLVGRNKFMARHCLHRFQNSRIANITIQSG